VRILLETVAAREEDNGEAMSERDRRGCWLTMLGLAVLVLVVYMVVDNYCDRNAEHEIRDLQRRVGQLESEKR
jgi:hypothetical protein